MTTNILIPNGRAIIFNYPAGAGGKMLQNCVALSRYCVLSSLQCATWQLNYLGKITRQYYQYKLQRILASLPPPDRMNDWLNSEFKEKDLYGINFEGFNRHDPMPNNVAMYRLAQQGLYSTVSVHNWGAVEHYACYWPTLKHVCLVNSEQFARFCLPIKNSSLQYDLEWIPEGGTPKDQCFEFDIDGTMWTTDLFVKQVADLYNYLGFDDFQADLITLYHQHYIGLHQ